jgi:hypothetical protein
MVKEFTEQEILQGRNHADLGEAGDFTAEWLEGEGNHWIAYGIYTPVLEQDREETLAFFLEEDPENIEDMTAGEIFNMAWDIWEI